MKKLILFVILGCLTQLLTAQNPAGYLTRQQAYRDSAVNKGNFNALPIQAYEGVSLNTSELTSVLGNIPTKSTSDFDIVKLVRIMFLTNGQYDNQIFAVLDSIPFWLTKSDTLRGYWSENHMMQWMSSNWLLHEEYGRPADASLRDRIIHYLELKRDYGFYEFFSTTYQQYTLAPLLNLHDFAQDTTISNLAGVVARRLLSDVMLQTTESGAFYPVAGRNYIGRYDDPFYTLSYLLTGRGNRIPTEADHAGQCLATSSLDVSSVINSWTAELDTLYQIGHSAEDAMTLHSHLPFVDEMMFKWSSGMYFHPIQAQQSAQFLVDSNLWNHVDFEPLKILSLVSPTEAGRLSQDWRSIATSSAITRADIRIFKNHNVALSSLQDFWPGKVGYQQWPIMATVGDQAIFTASGEVLTNWSSMSSNFSNMHLPFVTQEENVALLQYWPEEFRPPLADFTKEDVTLHWADSWFDETRTNGNWLLGRIDQNFIAVRRPCLDQNKGWNSCLEDEVQSWVFIVGDSMMYASFDSFEAKVELAQFQETLSGPDNARSYNASINFDGKMASNNWQRDLTVGIDDFSFEDTNAGFKVYPNPAADRINIELTDRSIEEIQLINSLGQTLQIITKPGTKSQLDVSDLQAGLYFLQTKSAKGNNTQRLIVR